MEHYIQLTRKELRESLQVHWLLPVSLNGLGPFMFAVEPSRYRTLVTARIIETLGVAIDALPNALPISEKLAFPLLRLHSVEVGNAVLNDFEVVVWGWPVIPPELLATYDESTLYPLGNFPPTPVESILECRGVLGFDFLRHFRVTFDFSRV